MTIYNEMRDLSDEDIKIVQEILDIFSKKEITIRNAKKILKGCLIKVHDFKINGVVE